jgi:hypothetical protein
MQKQVVGEAYAFRDENAMMLALFTLDPFLCQVTLGSYLGGEPRVVTSAYAGRALTLSVEVVDLDVGPASHVRPVTRTTPKRNAKRAKGRKVVANNPEDEILG